MQRKRTRGGYYSENIELGTHLIPVAQMKKFTMKKLIKYVIIALIVCFVYVVYQKIVQASRNDVDADYWQESNIINKKLEHNTNKHDPEKDVEKEENLERRVKEEVHKVFEELKQKQQEKDEKEIKRDVFEEYKVKNKLNGVDKMEDDIREMVETILEEEEEEGNDDVPNDNAFPPAQYDDEQDDVAVSDDVLNDDTLFEVEEDPEQEKQELEAEKEIEERLADAFKDAANEAADAILEANENAGAQSDVIKQDELKKEDVINQNDIKQDVKIPEVQKKEFNFAVNNMGRNLHPFKVEQMNEKARRDALKHDSDHEFPPFVTAARKTNFAQVQQLVASIQHMMPGRKIYVYDLDLDKEQKKQLMSYCGVKVHYFMKEIFPKYVSDFDKLHWKPLVIQTALAEFGHVIWVNPGYRLGSNELAPLVHDSHEQGVVVVGQSASYSTFSATHPDMYNFIPTDKDKLTYHPHVEIRAILIHNTPEVHENIMRVYTACALEESCLAPKGAKTQCKFDLTGRKYADCHRYDESALNILLKNWFNFDMTKYVIRSSIFKPTDPSYKPKLKNCRDPNGIRDSEL